MNRSRLELVIAGAEKAGTSSLKSYIGQHPEICTHSQTEMMYFADSEEHRRGRERAWSRYFGGCADDAVLVAKNVSILHGRLAAVRLHAHNPLTEIVTVLRNPVDRAYSAYWHSRRMGWETISSFERALAAEAKRLTEREGNAERFAYVARGRYAPQVERLQQLFGVERVHVILLEDLQEDAAAVCRRLFEILGVASDFVPGTSSRLNESAAPRSVPVARIVGTRNPLSRVAKRLLPASARDRVRAGVARLNERPWRPPPMSERTRARLIDEFASDNDRLEQLIHRSLAHWSQ